MSRQRLTRSLLALLIGLALAACGGDAPASGAPPDGAATGLAGTRWVVVAVDGRPPVAGAVPTLAFDATSVTGSGGCNHLGGQYQLDPASGRIAVREMGMTLMLCTGNGIDAYETAFFNGLAQATNAAIDPNGRLTLTGPAGQVILARLELPAASA